MPATPYEDPSAPPPAAVPATALPEQGTVADVPEATELRVRLDLAYDGSAFHGWAVQPGLATVQGVLEDALEQVVRRPVRTVVAGRTDTGVHAAHQTVHLDVTRTEWESLTRGRRGLDVGPALVRRLNGVLGRQGGAVVVRNARLAPAGFDARFSALRRHYRYRISDRLETRDPLRRRDTYWHRQALDVRLMQTEADGLLGLHDFLSFCKPRPGSTTIRELQSFRIERDDDGVVVARLTADAFCHHMVRALVGAVVAVGEGRRSVGWAVARLEAGERDSLSHLAPPHALVLSGVDYPPDSGLAARAAATRARRQSDDADARRADRV